MVEHIKENMANRVHECKALQMDAQDLKFENESFDAIVQRNVMWNLDELIPEMSAGEHSNIGVVAFAVGFSLMMALDVALG